MKRRSKNPWTHSAPPSEERIQIPSTPVPLTFWGDACNPELRAWLTTVAVPEAIQPLLPRWVQEIWFRLDSGEGAGGLCQINTNQYCYGRLSITICPSFWSETPSHRLASLCHEMVHAHCAPLLYFLDRTITPLIPEAQRTLLTALQSAMIEQTTESLANNFQRLLSQA